MAKKEIHEGNWGKSIISKGKWYFLSSLFTKGLGLFLIPIYTAHLKPYDYGILQNLNAIAFVLPMLLSLSLDAAFGRFYHDIKHDKKKVSELFSTFFWFIIIYGSLVLCLIFVSAKFWLPDLLEVPIYPYAFLSFIPALIMQLSILGQRFFEQSLRTKGIMLINTISAIINGGVSVILLTRFNLGIIARLDGIAIGAIVSFIAYFIYFIKSGILRLSFSTSVLKTSLIYSIPLVPSFLGSWIAKMTDKLVITQYVNLESAGLYAFAGQIALLVYLIGDAISRVINPITMSGLVNDKIKTKQKMGKFSLFLWSFMLWLILGAMLFSKEAVMLLASDEYQSAFKLIPIMAFIYVLGMQNRFPSQIISYHKKTWILTSGAIIMGLSNLVLNLLLVPKFGYEASAWTTILSTGIYSTWLFSFSQRIDPLIIEWKKYIIILLPFIIVVVSYLLYATDKEVTIKTIFIKIIVLILAALIMIFLTDKEILKKGKAYFTEKSDQ